MKISRSVMTSELHALLLAFDYGYIIRDMVKEILARSVRLDALVDSLTFFELIEKDGKKSERRPQIYTHLLKDSFAKRDLTTIGLIPGEYNPADALKKEKVNKNSPLRRLVKSNRFDLSPIGWAFIENMST